MAVRPGAVNRAGFFVTMLRLGAKVAAGPGPGQENPPRILGWAGTIRCVSLRADGGVSASPVAFETVHRIIEARCQVCHSDHPTHEGFTAPPLGVTFDTPEEIQATADRIEQMAVISKAMPLGNVTGMTQDERETLGAWIREGAKLE